MNPSDVNNALPVLQPLLHMAIQDSVKDIADKCERLGTAPQEPDFIASLTLNFTPGLYKILTLVFPENRFSVTGVYCHQKPIVDIGLSKDPELGDILFVYIHTDEMGTKKYNSLLLQAKKTRATAFTVPPSDQHQLSLYTGWPKFTYKRAGKLNGIVRDVVPKTINDGAQYLLIDDDPSLGLSGLPGTFPMGCAIPAKNISLDDQLSFELIDFFKFKAGRGFDGDPGTSRDDWSKMVWELLEVTKDKASKRKNAGFIGFPRQVTHQFDGCCFFASGSASIFHDLHDRLQGNDLEISSLDYYDEENFSPSVILIESGGQG